MLFELDDPSWFGVSPVVVRADTASDLAEDILREQAYGDLRLPEDPAYLGLAVGMAYGEVAFARKLNIPPNKMFLLDEVSYPRPTPAMALPVGATFIQSGVFKFLANPTLRGFSVVSLFGAEFLLGYPAKARALVSLLPPILKTPAVICTMPFGHDGVLDIWKEYGFRSLNGLPSILAYDPGFSPKSYCKSPL